MLPSLSAQPLAILDYIANETEPGEDIPANQIATTLTISKRTVRRAVRRLGEFGLVSRGETQVPYRWRQWLYPVRDYRDCTGDKTVVTVRITPLGRRLIAAYYRSATPNRTEEAAK